MHPEGLSDQVLLPTPPPGVSKDGGGGGRGELARGLGRKLFSFGGAYWPLATELSDPLWV